MQNPVTLGKYTALYNFIYLFIPSRYLGKYLWSNNFPMNHTGMNGIIKLYYFQKSTVQYLYLQKSTVQYL